MLDVHPPHEKIHGIRDFLLHVLTMTVGLFIALLLEGLVERRHKAELRHEAEVNLRQEMEDNAKRLAAAKTPLAEERQSLTAVLGFLKAKEEGRTLPVQDISLGFSLGSLQTASWRTAQTTGALALMDYGQAKQYATVYQVQDRVEQLQTMTFEDFLQLQSYVLGGFDPAKFTAAQAVTAEPEVRRTLAHLEAMGQLDEVLDQQYTTVLKELPQ